MTVPNHSPLKIGTRSGILSDVARHFGIPPRKPTNFPYCQRRERIVGSKFYYGETHDPALLRLICEALGNSELVFCYDDHEKRLRDDLLRRLLPS